MKTEVLINTSKYEQTFPIIQREMKFGITDNNWEAENIK